MIYDLSATPEITFGIRVRGELTDPTTITLLLRDPLGRETSITYPNAAITRIEAGVYAWQPAQPPLCATGTRTYFFRLKTTGAAPGGYEGQFQVAQTRFVSP